MSAEADASRGLVLYEWEGSVMPKVLSDVLMRTPLKFLAPERWAITAVDPTGLGEVLATNEAREVLKRC